MSAHEILPNLWISDASFVQELLLDPKLIPNLVAILNVTTGISPSEDLLCSSGVICLHVPLPDVISKRVFHMPILMNLYCNKLQEAYQFISFRFFRGAVLVHCAAGVNRSVSIVAGFLANVFDVPINET